jgi:hypothetical protein
MEVFLAQQVEETILLITVEILTHKQHPQLEQPTMEDFFQHLAEIKIMEL